MTDQHDESADRLPEPIRTLLASPDSWAEPPAGLQAEILRSMRTERDQQSAPGADSSDVVEPHVGGRVLRLSTRRVRHWRWLAAAAAAVVVAGLGIGIATLRGSSPDAVVALAGTDLAPAASGQAEIRDKPSGFEIILDTDGLRASPPGRFYEAWLKNAAGDLVPIGTFHARSGGDDVILWSGVDPRAYGTLTVTVQREGAGVESSGQVVLLGSVE